MMGLLTVVECERGLNDTRATMDNRTPWQRVLLKWPIVTDVLVSRLFLGHLPVGTEHVPWAGVGPLLEEGARGGHVHPRLRLPPLVQAIGPRAPETAKSQE